MDGPSSHRHGRGMPSLLYAPLAIAAAYIVVLVVLLPRIIGAYTWISDVASAFTIPTSLAQSGTGGHTVMSTTGQYVSLWFGLLTAGLPLHRAVWELAPVACFLATALAIGWSVLQVMTRRAAILSVALAIVVSPLALSYFATAYSHNIAYLDTALLGAYVVWLLRARPRRRLAAYTVPLLAGVVLGVGVASDLLLLVSGIAPFAFAATLGALRRDRRSRIFAVSALTTLAVAALVALLTSRAMGAYGLLVARPPARAAPLSALALHSEFLLEGLELLFGGYLGGKEAPGAARSVVGAASDVVMAAALLMLLALGVAAVVRLLDSVRRHRGQVADLDLATRMHVVYWAGSAISTVGAFELSVEANGPHPQYYATLIFSVAAIAPLLIRTSPGAWLVTIGAATLFTASVVGIFSKHFEPGPFEKDEQAIVSLANANHATTGYAGYWYASSLTWNSQEQVRVRPVSSCENPAGPDICRFNIATVPSWYAPTRQRSFLLVNPTETFLPDVPRGLGKPLAAYAVGESTDMYIYPYNIASRLGG
jgi:hypothetical protein